MLLNCKSCTAKYAASLKACPQCGSTERHDEGAEPAVETAAAQQQLGDEHGQKDEAGQQRPGADAKPRKAGAK